MRPREKRGLKKIRVSLKKTGGRFEGAQKSALYKKEAAVSKKKKTGRVLQFRYQIFKRPQSIYV